MKIRHKYMKLTKVGKIEFREKCMKSLQISYSKFYSWVQRDSVPTKYEKEYNSFIKRYEK